MQEEQLCLTWHFRRMSEKNRQYNLYNKQYDLDIRTLSLTFCWTYSLVSILVTLVKKNQCN